MKYKLGELVTAISGYAFKRKQFSENGDIPVIKIKNIESPKIVVDSNTNRISKSLFEKLIRYHVKQNDILISLTGSHIEQIGSMVGKVGMYDQKEPAILNQRVAKLCVKSTNKLDPTYFYYWILRKEVQRLLASQAAGTANQANISVNDIYELEIELPSLENQIIISNRIKKLDRKIQLNNQINDNLVNFIQELFSQFNTCSKVPLKNIATISSSKRIYAKDYTSKGIPFYRGKEISLLSEGIKPDNNLFISPTKFKEINKKKPSPQSDDILITAVGTIGNIYQVEKSVLPFYFKDGNVIAIKPKTIYSNYLFYWLKSNKGQDQIKTIMIGSTQKALTINSISKLLITLPSKDELKQFNNIINPLKEQISKNKKENNTLLEFRQLLLNLYF